MTNPELSNSIRNDSVVLWQYDQAPTLIALISKLNDISESAVTDYWDYLYQFVFAVDTADSFGLNVLGNLMGISRPKIKVPGKDETTISDDLYRRLLKARFYIMRMPPTCEVYNRYLSLLFPSDEPIEKVDGEVVWYKPRNSSKDFQDMSMGFTFPVDATEEEAYLIFQHYETVYSFPTGIRTNCSFVQKDKVIGFEGQNLNNFSEVFAWATDKRNGGIFSTTEGANYKQDPAVKGDVYIVDTLSDGPECSLTVKDNGLFWLDWGDGESTYVEGKTTYAHTYKEKGLFAVAVYTDKEGFVETGPSGTHYQL